MTDRRRRRDWALTSLSGQETKHGEAETAVLLTLNVFLLLLAYYLLKVAREPLILVGGGGGAEVKSYASAGQAVLTIFLALGYGALAQRAGRVRLISIVMLFFAANLVIFAALYRASVPIGVPFYLWVGVFNMAAIAQFWGFAADLFDEERGKRMFPILGIGSSTGAVAGSWIAKKALPLGPGGLMLIAGGILVVCVVLTIVIDRIERRIHPKSEEVSKAPIVGKSGFELLIKDKYLILLGAFMLIYNWVNTTGEYVLDRTLLAAAANQGDAEAFVGAFKANFFAWVNIIGVVLQVLVVSRIIKYLGVRVALFIMPAVSLISYSGMAIAPILSFIFVAKVAENSLDYSLLNTSRQALWLVTSREAKYKVKQIVDTFLVRSGDMMSAALVYVGTWIGLSTRGFAMANVVLVCCWITILLLVAREHKLRSGGAKAPRQGAAAAAAT